MKRLFTDRARLVVYVEATDLNRLTEKARGEGQTVVEWAREKLLGELDDLSAVRSEREVPMARRGAGLSAAAASAGKPEGATEPSRIERVCAHGVARGYHCWQCKGRAVINAHD